MFKAQDTNGKWVVASNALRDRQYYCPVCREVLTVIRDSKHKVDHFRHHPDSSCSHSADETIEHADKKVGIYSELQAALGDSNVQMEYRLPDGQRPDIYFETGGQGVAVEVQHSHISDKDLIDRTASYSDKRVASLWMPDNIKRFLNAVDLYDGTSLAKIPPWMRRIANLTDDVAYDHYADTGKPNRELVSIQLALKTRRVKNKVGDWVMEYYWPKQSCILYAGNVRTDRNDSGHKLMLWIPRPVGGEGLVSTRSKKQQLRREITENHGGFVDCRRTPTTPELSKPLYQVLEPVLPGKGIEQLASVDLLEMWQLKERQLISTPVSSYVAIKKRLQAMYKKVHELEHDSGFLVETTTGQWLVFDKNGLQVR